MELLKASFSLYNLPFTVLLLLAIAYWVLVLVGGADADGPDFDPDGSVDGLLDFLGIGELPVMVVFSVFSLVLWTIVVLSNHYLGTASLGFALLLLVPEVVVAFVAAKYLSWPIGRVFRLLDRDEKLFTATGSVCRMLTSAGPDSLGQAEVETDGAPLLLTVRTARGQELKKGDTALVVERVPDQDVYLVIQPERTEQ